MFLALPSLTLSSYLHQGPRAIPGGRLLTSPPGEAGLSFSDDIQGFPCRKTPFKVSSFTRPLLCPSDNPEVAVYSRDRSEPFAVFL